MRRHVKEGCCGSEPEGGKILRTRTTLFLPTIQFRWCVNRGRVGNAGLTLEFVGVAREAGAGNCTWRGENTTVVRACGKENWRIDVPARLVAGLAMGPRQHCGWVGPGKAVHKGWGGPAGHLSGFRIEG
jgi:hypothetical protein